MFGVLALLGRCAVSTVAADRFLPAGDGWIELRRSFNFSGSSSNKVYRRISTRDEVFMPNSP